MSDASNKNFVKVKDLEIGRLYGDWRNWHLYLGRTQNKGFAWLYIGDPEGLMQDTIKEIRWSLSYEYGFQITKQNKKIERSPGNLKDIYIDINRLPNYIKQELRFRGVIIGEI